MAAELSETDEHDFSDVDFDEQNVVYLQALFRGALVRKQFRELRLSYNTIVADTERNAHMTVDWSRQFSPNVLHVRKLRQRNQLVCPSKNIDIINQSNAPQNDDSQKPGHDLNSLTAPHDPLSKLSNDDICKKTSCRRDPDAQYDEVSPDSQDSSLTVTKTISQHANISNSPRTASKFDMHHLNDANISSENIKREYHFNSETEHYLNNDVTNKQPVVQSHPNIEFHETVGEDSGWHATESLPEETHQLQSVKTVVNDAANYSPDVICMMKDVADVSDDIIMSRDDDSHVQHQSVDNHEKSEVNDVRIPQQTDDKTTSYGQQQITCEDAKLKISAFPDMTSVWESCSSFEAPTVKSYPQDPKDLQELRKNMAMELLWIQQAIGSRKNYLRLKSQMNQ